MKNYIVIVYLIVFMPNLLSGQTYSGMVIDKDSKEPLPYANIFQEGTLNGTITNKEGQFELSIKENISAPIVISFVGYITKVYSVNALAKEPIITLEQKVLSIDEIEVKSGSSAWSRAKMLQVFKEEFLGTSFNAKSCKIKNEDDIYLFYNGDTQVLHASSQNDIIIENRLLGYRIYYLLEYFKKSSSGIQFKGYSRFEERDFKSARAKIRIDKERKDTYLGSIMHFIRFLFGYNINENDTIYDLKVLGQIYNYHAYDYPLDESISDDLSFTSLVSKNEVNNTYLKKYMNKFQLYNAHFEFLSPKSLIFNSDYKKELFSFDTVRIIYLGNLKNSMMILKSGIVEIFEDGYFNPEQISWGGAMSRQRVGDLLPLEYQYDETVPKK
jgi:hypothetical protein